MDSTDSDATPPGSGTVHLHSESTPGRLYTDVGGVGDVGGLVGWVEWAGWAGCAEGCGGEGDVYTRLSLY